MCHGTPFAYTLLASPLLLQKSLRLLNITLAFGVMYIIANFLV